jgi:hypothetical protein
VRTKTRYQVGPAALQMSLAKYNGAIGILKRLFGALEGLAGQHQCELDDIRAARG